MRLAHFSCGVGSHFWLAKGTISRTSMCAEEGRDSACDNVYHSQLNYETLKMNMEDRETTLSVMVVEELAALPQKVRGLLKVNYKGVFTHALGCGGVPKSLSN